MKLSRRLLSIAFLSASVLIGACGKGPMDTPLVMDKGIEAYRLDLATRAEKMSSEDLEAFNWAVDELNFEQLIQIAPNKSPREVIRKVVANAKAHLEMNMAPTEKAVAEYDEVRAELMKIVVSDIKFEMEKSYFDRLEPKLSFLVTNGSRFEIGATNWMATLMLNGAAEPHAKTDLTTYYKIIDKISLKPGESYREQHRLSSGFDSFDWRTPAVTQAKTKEVFVEQILSSVSDPQNNRILPKSPYPRMEQLKGYAEAVERFGSI